MGKDLYHIKQAVWSSRGGGGREKSGRSLQFHEFFFVPCLVMRFGNLVLLLACYEFLSKHVLPSIFFKIMRKKKNPISFISILSMHDYLLEQTNSEKD